MKRLLAALAALALTAAAAPTLAQSPIEQAYTAQAGSQLKRSLETTDLFDNEGLRIILCGTSAPMPDAARAKSCAVVVAGGKAYVVDTGPESWKVLGLMNFPGARIAGIFLTHFHSDHIGDLGEFRMQTEVAGRNFKLPVYGPKGVQTVVNGINMAYSLDDHYRYDHHGPTVIDLASFPLVAHTFGKKFTDARDGEEVILRDGDVTVTAFQVNHDPIRPAVGYRFDYRGRSVVFSGDTTVWPNLVANAKGADVLVAESLSAKMSTILSNGAKAAGLTSRSKVLLDILTYHATPVQVAQMANDAGVKFLVYTHFAPPVPNPMLMPLYMEGVEAVRPQAGWVAGFDGLRIDLPVGSTEVKRVPPK